MCFFILIFSCKESSKKEVAENTKKQPNIIYILADDLGYGDLGITGHPHIKTPHLDALADSGIRFDHAFVTTAICSPSRAACLSGQYGSRNGVPTLAGELAFPHAAFPHALAKAGYRTTHIGKWHLDTTPQQAGFQQFAKIYSNGSWFQREIQTNIPGAPKKLDGVFYETVMADLVMNRISDHLTNHSKQPFFIWWCNQVPHVDNKYQYPDLNTDPSQKTQQQAAGTAGGFRHFYQVEDMPVPSNWHDPLDTKPTYLAKSRFVTHSASFNYGGTGGYAHPTHGKANVRQHMLEYYAAVSALDAEIGRVLAHLEDPNGDGDKF